MADAREVQNVITCYFGNKGSGKTTRMRRAVARSERLLVHDPMGQFEETTVVCETMEELTERVKAGELDSDKSFRFSLRDPYVETVPWLCELASNVQDCDLALDEADWSVSATQVPPEVRAVISYSRHRGINIHAGARRPARVPRDLTSQADVIVCFRIKEPRDLDYIAEFCGPDFAERVRRLRGHQCITWRGDDEADDVTV